jgi:hypothetical protein
VALAVQVAAVLELLLLELLVQLILAAVVVAVGITQAQRADLVLSFSNIQTIKQLQSV